MKIKVKNVLLANQQLSVIGKDREINASQKKCISITIEIKKDIIKYSQSLLHYRFLCHAYLGDNHMVMVIV